MEKRAGFFFEVRSETRVYKYVTEYVYRSDKLTTDKTGGDRLAVCYKLGTMNVILKHNGPLQKRANGNYAQLCVIIYAISGVNSLDKIGDFEGGG